MADQVLQRTLGVAVPALRDRLMLAEMSFRSAGKQSALAEDVLADAVNRLLKKVAPQRFTGANTLQLHLFRVSTLR
ncbi:MAG TPA: hypothetical protein VMG82_33430, partial [Candidatus Sulfotelmatobacter sp.]|nr:hypothetical protein [Candidatus Sulfotelmatobacter sp.]